MLKDAIIFFAVMFSGCGASAESGLDCGRVSIRHGANVRVLAKVSLTSLGVKVTYPDKHFKFATDFSPKNQQKLESMCHAAFVKKSEVQNEK